MFLDTFPDEYFDASCTRALRDVLPGLPPGVSVYTLRDVLAGARATITYDGRQYHLRVLTVPVGFACAYLAPTDDPDKHLILEYHEGTTLCDAVFKCLISAVKW